MEIMKNNSNEMKTVVETFIIEETAELIYDNEQLEKWNKHVEELGLVGQTKIRKKEKSPIPFMHMKSNLVNVFNELCPVTVDVEAYDITPIPVEILDLVALSKREGYFDKIQIWYDDKKPDPACVGFVYLSEDDRMNKYDWRGNFYLLGKWADVKHSFEELRQMAINRWKKSEEVECKDRIKYYSRRIEDVDLEAQKKFGHDSPVINNDLPF